MSILVPCSRCATMLSAPDNAAGKCIRCPKPGCGALAEVPAFLPVEEIAVVDAKPVRSKPAREDDEDDRPRKTSRRHKDDDDDFDRPRRRKKKGLGAGVIVAIVFGSLLALGGIGYGVYALVGGKGAASAGKKIGPPAGWQQFTYPKDNFKAYFPQEPSVNEASGGRAPAGVGGMHLPSQMTAYLPRDFGSGTKIAVVVQLISVDAETQTIQRKQLRDMFLGVGQSLNSKTVNWLGVEADEFSTPDGATVRVAFVGTKMYMATISHTNPGRLSSDEVNGFFDNFELLK